MNTIRQVCAGMALIVLLAAASPARAQSTVDLVNLFDGPCERYGVPKPLALAIAGHESDMKAAFEAKYQRDWNDPAGDDMKAVWAEAWAAAKLAA